MSRVVVTGIGLTTPLGSRPDDVWRHLTAGRSGIGPLTLFDASTLPVRIGGEVGSVPVAQLTERFPAAAGIRDRKVWLGLHAAEEAIRSAGVAAADLGAALLHVGVSLEAFSLEDVTPVAAADDMGHALAARVLGQGGHPEVQVPLDRLAELLGARYGFVAGRFTNCSACAAGAQAVGEAFQALRAGEADLALAGAADSMLNPLGVGGFSLLQVLSTENDQPQRACRPFDRTREGTVLGEGAAFLVLETLERARARGAAIHAEILGYGSSLDAYHMSDPAPDCRGAAHSMRLALRDGRLAPAQVDCVSAHGTGTPKNDVVETLAIKEVLGARAHHVPVHSVKSMTGHLIAASGAAEAAVAVLTLHEGVVPPTINLVCPDPQCDLDYVPHASRPFHGRTVLSNSFGFGGQNATLLFGRLA
jgi:3-oxoacyl-[acyl-carrier-protein] synthase II